jgi:hypothetical protein
MLTFCRIKSFLPLIVKSDGYLKFPKERRGHLMTDDSCRKRIIDKELNTGEVYPRATVEG